MSYNDSRAEGTRARGEGDDRHEQPLPADQLCAGRLLPGRGDRRRHRQRYRQRPRPGGRGPGAWRHVDRRRPQADGRRQDVGPNPPGQGAEITLHEVPMLPAMGLTMTGPRPGGFGSLNDRTNEICATGDLICSAPKRRSRSPTCRGRWRSSAAVRGNPCTPCTPPHNSGISTANPPRSGHWTGHGRSSITLRIQNMADT